MNSYEIESRRVKAISKTGKENWVTEIGEDVFEVKDSFTIKESSTNKNVRNIKKQPVFIRKDTLKEFQYRIRNLNYDTSNFQIEIDKATNEIVIKTLNKKYYKRFKINDLANRNISLEEKNISVEFLNATLIISYLKPKEILDENQKVIDEIKNIKKEIEKNPEKKYGSDCQNQ